MMQQSKKYDDDNNNNNNKRNNIIVSITVSDDFHYLFKTWIIIFVSLYPLKCFWCQHGEQQLLVVI